MSKVKILYVEDELFLGKIVKESLETRGFEVIMESDGAKATALYKKSEPDICVLDIMLPKLDGYKVCRLLKFDERYRQIPIIILSARTQEGDQTLAKEMGANRFITKPYEFSEILAHMEALLKTPSVSS